MSRSCATIYFYGDGRLPSNGMHGGHFTHRPSRSGGVVCEYGNLPACLDDWTAILPYVTFDPADKAQRSTGHAVEQGQGMGVARYRRIGGWCILALWDRTGDVRGNSVAIFYTREELGAAALLQRVQVEYPELWRRITRRGGVRIGGPSDPDPAAMSAAQPNEGQEAAITLDDAAPGLWEAACAKIERDDAELRIDDAATDGSKHGSYASRLMQQKR
jgi:hypothetical protein